MLTRAIIQGATHCGILIDPKGLTEEQSTRSLICRKMSVADRALDMLIGSTAYNKAISDFGLRARSIGMAVVAEAVACRRWIGRWQSFRETRTIGREANPYVWRPG